MLNYVFPDMAGTTGRGEIHVGTVSRPRQSPEPPPTQFYVLNYEILRVKLRLALGTLVYVACE